MFGSWHLAEPTVRKVDALVALWMLGGLVLATWTAITAWSLADLGSTVVAAGRALETAGRGLQQLGDLPVVGGAPGQLGDQVRATAGRVIANGTELTGQVRQLAVLLGLSTFLLPLAPVLGVWLPLRVSRRRDVRRLEDALRGHGQDAGLHRYLASRAVEHLPYQALTRVTSDPYGDLAEGRWVHLATLELERMGLVAPPTWSSLAEGNR